MEGEGSEGEGEVGSMNNGKVRTRIGKRKR